MKRCIRGVLVILVAGLARSTQGGTITSGSFSLSGFTASATVSGDNFTATVIDDNSGFFTFNGSPPFQPTIPVLTWADLLGGVLYNGVFYSAPPFGPGPIAGVPYSGATFTEHLISSPPIVTGPGTYSVGLFSVTLTFYLYDSSHTLFHTETDTGFATGSINYTADVPGNTFVFGHSVEATIVPEPSTWSYIAFAACCLGAFAGIRGSVVNYLHTDPKNKKTKERNSA